MPRPPFPHMMPLDIPLFASFVLGPHGRNYDRWEFDVSLSEFFDPGPLYTPAQRRQAIYLNGYKIDVLAWQSVYPTIIECKPSANLAALGQLVGYQQYFFWLRGIWARTMLICEELNPMAKRLLDHHGIDVHVVPPASEYQVLLACQYVGERNCTALPDLFPQMYADQSTTPDEAA